MTISAHPVDAYELCQAALYRAERTLSGNVPNAECLVAGVPLAASIGHAPTGKALLARDFDSQEPAGRRGDIQPGVDFSRASSLRVFRLHTARLWISNALMGSGIVAMAVALYLLVSAFSIKQMQSD